MVFIPATEVLTETARGLLPRTVPLADAAANAGRAALLVEALTRRPELLLPATEDRLHQDYRAAAMPDSAALVAALRSEGVPAVISGAGPTVLALTDEADVDKVLAVRRTVVRRPPAAARPRRRPGPAVGRVTGRSGHDWQARGWGMCEGVGSVNLMSASGALRGPVRRVPISASRCCGIQSRSGTTILREPTTARTQPACAIAAASRSRVGA